MEHVIKRINQFAIAMQVAIDGFCQSRQIGQKSSQY